MTSNSFRLGSTDSCCVAGGAVTHFTVDGHQEQPAASASTARGTCGGSATVAITSPAASAALRSSSASRTGATAMDSVTGPGTHHRPRHSAATTRSTGCASIPSNFSGTASAVTPRSASAPIPCGQGRCRPRPTREPRRADRPPPARRRCLPRSRAAARLDRIHLACSLGSRGSPNSRSAMMLR